MTQPWHDIVGGTAAMILIADHASACVPEGIDLDVPAVLMHEHVAVDIGVAPLAHALCTKLGCPGILGAVSRLVIDLNREEDAPSLIPEASDGHPIPGNVGLPPLQRAERIGRLWRAYHRHIADSIATTKPKLLISLHSFTPMLRGSGAARPWEVGVLYNRDERAARIALPLLAKAGIIVGDNLPYSGKLLNATMNCHGEGNGIAYLGLEVRQDLIDREAGVARWSGLLAPIIQAVHVQVERAG